MSDLEQKPQAPTTPINFRARMAEVGEVRTMDGGDNGEKKSRIIPLRWTTSAEVVRFGYVPEYGFAEFREILYPEGADLTRLNNGAALLDSHNAWSTRSVIGVVVEGTAKMEGPNGYADVRLSDAPGDADVTQKIADKIVRNVSVGYALDAYEWRQPKSGMVELHVTRWSPLEVSAVPIPADHGAQFLRALNAPCLTKGEHTMSNATQSTQAPETPATPIPAAAAVDVAEVRKAERDRVRFCEDFAARQGIDPVMTRTIIDRGESKEATITALWEAAATRVASLGPQQVGLGAQVGAEPADHLREKIKSAILVRMGRENPAIQNILTDADKKLAGGMERGGFCDFARDMAQAIGQPMPRYATQSEIIERSYATTPVQYRSGGAMTTSDLPSITVDAVNVAIIRLSEVSPLNWQQFCEVYNPSVHQNIHFPVLSSGFLLGQVTENQEATIATISDSEETADMGVFSKAFLMSHMLLQNDRFGEIARQTAMFGQAIPRTRDNTVVTALASNPTMSDSVTFYHADHGNLAGTGAAPTVANLISAYEALYAIEDLSGQPIGAQPLVMLAPIGAAILAEQFLGRTVTPAVTTSLTTVLPSRVGSAITTIIDHPRLTGTAWYLLGTIIKALFAGTIDGSNLPTVVMEYDATRRTFKVVVSDEFYCAPINWRVAYKNAGA